MNFLAAFFGSLFVGRAQRRRWEQEMSNLYAEMERREEAALAETERREEIAYAEGFHEGYEAGLQDSDSPDSLMAGDDNDDDDDFDDEYEDDFDSTVQEQPQTPRYSMPAWQPLMDARVSQRRADAHGSARKNRAKKTQSNVPGPWGGTETRKDGIDG